MAIFTLEEYYGFPHKKSYHIAFEIELDEEEELELRDFLKKNGPCDYSYLEYEHGVLFERINDAANEAIIEDINSRRKRPLKWNEVDWCGIYYDFYWDERLLQSY